MNSYAFYGLCLRSRMALPALPHAPLQIEGSNDISLETGDVPHTLEDIVWSSPFVQIARDGEVLIQIAAIGRFLVSGGRRILVCPAPDATEPSVQTVLLSIAAGAVLHLHGVLPLHASCVIYRDKVLAIAGPAGRGKSTLAAALIAKGATLISEDITVVHFANDTPLAVQGATGLRLWPDSKEAVGADGGEWRPVRPGHAKSVRFVPSAPLAPRRLDAILRLKVENGAVGPGLSLKRGPAAAMPMSELIYRLPVGRALGRGESLFTSLMQLADSVPIFELRRPADLNRLDTTIGLVDQAVMELKRSL